MGFLAKYLSRIFGIENKHTGYGIIRGSFDEMVCKLAKSNHKSICEYLYRTDFTGSHESGELIIPRTRETGLGSNTIYTPPDYISTKIRIIYEVPWTYYQVFNGIEWITVEMYAFATVGCGFDRYSYTIQGPWILEFQKWFADSFGCVTKEIIEDRIRESNEHQKKMEAALEEVRLLQDYWK